VTVISVVGQIGALIGGTTLGYSSTFIGRRLTMITGCFIGGALVPAYIIPRSMVLVASAFFLQFFVGGVWGVIPIHLTELAPPALRTTAVGFTYQLGNLASSASATIQAVIGERYPLPPHNGEKRFNYGKVIAIFMGAIWAGQIVFLFLGPEMSEDERAEYGASANELEALRKQGMSLKDIGAQRAMGQMRDVSPVSSTQEKPVDIEHVEREQEK
jgi:SHS family lactate transporter-like MFS transporter